MLDFATDYTSGALPEIMEALQATNRLATPGYGADRYCEAARQKIREACKKADLEVYFTSGGTQTNASVIDSVVRPGQGVIAVETTHINVHESGAVEAYGHKVLTLPQHDGKMDASELDRWLADFYADDTWPHMVEPGMVYITFPTEYGTLYTRQELTRIHDVCLRYGKPLYIDGARLGYGLAASADIKLEDLPGLCDVFYIGGTKQGTLFGEAVVANPGVLHNFFTQTKRHGGLIAKGRILGVQFCALFTDNLYMKSSERAVRLAAKLRKAFTDAGYEAIGTSTTNQQFFRLPNVVIDRLSKSVSFELWGARGETDSVVRFVTSWATEPDDVERLGKLLIAVGSHA